MGAWGRCSLTTQACVGQQGCHPHLTGSRLHTLWPQGVGRGSGRPGQGTHAVKGCWSDMGLGRQGEVLTVGPFLSRPVNTPGAREPLCSSWGAPGTVSLRACPLMGDLESTVNPVNHLAQIQQVFLEHLSWAGPFTSVRPTSVLEEAPGGSWGWAGGGAAVTQSGLALSHSLEGLTLLSPGEFLRMLTCGPMEQIPGWTAVPGCAPTPGSTEHLAQAGGRGQGRAWQGCVGFGPPLSLQLSILGPHLC